MMVQYGIRPVDMTQQNKMEKYTELIEIPKEEGDTIIVPFEFQIPKQAKRSYTVSI